MKNTKKIMFSPYMKFAYSIIFLANCGLTVQASGPVAFEDLKVIFKKHCLTCHNSERPRGGLDMTTKTAILAGSDSGVSITAGKATESLLYRLAAHLEAPHMPPNSPKIPDRDLEQIKIWIELGLPERKDIAKLDAKLIDSVVKPASPTGSVAMAAKPMENDSGNKNDLNKKSGSAGTLNGVSPDGQIKTISSNTSRVAVTSLAWSDKLGGVLRPITGGVALLEEKGNVVRSFPFPEKEITKVRLSPDGKLLLIAGGEGAQTGRVDIIDIADGSRKFESAEELDTVMAADLKPVQISRTSQANSGLIALGGPAKVVKVFSLLNGKILYSMKKHIDWVLDIRFSPDGLLMASADRSGTILLSEAETGGEVLVLRGHTGAVNTVAWMPHGNSLISGGSDGFIRLWDTHFGKDLGIFQAHQGGVTQVEVLADGRILSTGRDKTVKLWSSNFELSETLGTTDKIPLSLSAKPGKIVVGESDGKLNWISLDSNKLLASSSQAKPKANNDVLPNSGNSEMVQPMVTGVPITDRNNADLLRKKELLNTLELAAEKLKDDAARSPENKELTEGYIQLCRTILALKGEIVKIEKSNSLPNLGNK